jgi:hypothetical protein
MILAKLVRGKFLGVPQPSTTAGYVLRNVAGKSRICPGDPAGLS